jgi:hypothetical protein
MIEKNTRINQDEGDDFLPWESDAPAEGTSEEFVLNDDELIQLVKYWHRQILGLRWFYFLTGDRWGFGTGRKYFAQRRIDHAAKAIGKAAVDQAIKEVRDKFKANVDDARLWDLFENGDSWQWAAMQDEY